MNIEKWVQSNTIHTIIAGSRLYGTAGPDSDVDVRGVCLAPPETLIGLSEFKQFQGEGDTVIYELRRFCHLALGANPNILDLLMATEESWQIEDPRWRLIYANRHAFLSQKVRYTFSGYAVSQLKRIQRHRSWLVAPPDHQPTQEEYGGVWDGATYQFPKIAREKEYRTARTKWDNYQRWLKERNPRRAELERRYGYDTKYAAHLARLMVQARRLLRHGTYNPRLKGRDLAIVRDVLAGKWDYDRLVDWAEKMDEHVRNKAATSLPHSPNRKLVERLVMGIYLEELCKNDGRCGTPA